MSGGKRRASKYRKVKVATREVKTTKIGEARLKQQRKVKTTKTKKH